MMAHLRADLQPWQSDTGRENAGTRWRVPPLLPGSSSGEGPGKLVLVSRIDYSYNSGWGRKIFIRSKNGKAF
jgi:hypothetical protein